MKITILSLNNLLGRVVLALDGTFIFAAHYLDVARGAKERIDATMGAVGASALLGGLVDLNVLDGDSFNVQTLGLSVALSVLK